MHRILAILVLVGCASPHGSTRPSTDSPTDAPASADAPAPADAVTSTVADLRFAVVGDTRPKYQDDTPNYPTATITKIWQDVAAESPQPEFAIGTGDYMYASTTGQEQMPQLMAYTTARAAFPGPFYPAMGNHECTFYTTSNCGAGNTDGETANYNAFMQVMLGPLGVTKPYYSQAFAAPDGSWTAKLVVVACNAWDADQATWLDTALAEPTTYTFVARHEDVSATTAPCVTPVGAILANHPLTLLIVGHSHTYRHDAQYKQIIVGNGGAPLTTGMDWGYVIVARNPDGTLSVTAYNYMTHATLDTFRIAADGSPS
jgi:hypothetical protein